MDGKGVLVASLIRLVGQKNKPRIVIIYHYVHYVLKGTIEYFNKKHQCKQATLKEIALKLHIIKQKTQMEEIPNYV